jgi:signal transduction histidine kinase
MRLRRRSVDGRAAEGQGDWVFALVEQERVELSQQLHDGPLHEVVDAVVAIEAIAASNDQRLELLLVAGRLRTSIRRIEEGFLDTAPGDLAERGLLPALEELSRWASARGVALEVFGTHPGPYPPPVERLVFRVVRETMRSAMRYAGATRVRVRLLRRGDEIALTVVHDAGPRPVPGGGAPVGNGLRLLRVAAQDLGGSLGAVRAPDGTVVVNLQVPVVRR